MPYIGIFWQDFSKNYSSIRNQHPQTCLFAKFHDKKIIPKFATNCVWFMCFLDGIWKDFCHIWNQHPRISLTEKCCEKKYLKWPATNFSNCKILGKRKSNSGTKSGLFGCFCARFLKNYGDIWNQYLRICRIVKFCEETKMNECGTKNTLLRYFYKKCLIWVFLFKTIKNSSHIWNQDPHICLLPKFHKETIIPKFWT